MTNYLQTTCIKHRATLCTERKPSVIVMVIICSIRFTIRQMQICVLTLPSSSTILHPGLFRPIFPSIGYITSTLHFYLMHWMTGNLAESCNNCTQRACGGRRPRWWNLSSYHTNHYLSNPLLQSKGASIFWRGNQGRGRKAVQINSDKGLFSAAFIYDGMLLHRDQRKGFIRPADTSLIATESSPLMKCCHRRFSSQTISTLKKKTKTHIWR